MESVDQCGFKKRGEVLEVVVERALGDARLLEHHLDTDLLRILGIHEFDCRQQEALARGMHGLRHSLTLWEGSVHSPSARANQAIASECEAPDSR